MKHVVIFLILILTSCVSNNTSDRTDIHGFQVEETYANGEPAILVKKLADTLINDFVFSHKYKLQIDSLGQLRFEGSYINEQPIGLHRFYKKNDLIIVRDYKLPTSYQISFLKNIDSLIATSLNTKKTYLNSVLYIVHNDTLKRKSSFYKLSMLNSTNDSLKIHIEFFEPKIEIEMCDLYLDIPEDTSLVRIISFYGNEITFNKSSDKKGVAYISGFVLLNGYRVDKYNNDTIGATRLMFIKEVLK